VAVCCEQQSELRVPYMEADLLTNYAEAAERGPMDAGDDVDRGFLFPWTQYNGMSFSGTLYHAKGKAVPLHVPVHIGIGCVAPLILNTERGEGHCHASAALCSGRALPWTYLTAGRGAPEPVWTL
jgi:hypothetical protein